MLVFVGLKLGNEPDEHDEVEEDDEDEEKLSDELEVCAGDM